MPGVNRQGQAHIVSTAIQSPGFDTGSREVEAAPWFRTWFSVDPQPASISPTINVSIVFICTFPFGCSQIICHPAIKNDSGAIVSADSYIDFLLARSLLQRKGWRVTRPGAQSAGI
jgi:hypothetical protein